MKYDVPVGTLPVAYRRPTVESYEQTDRLIVTSFFIIVSSFVVVPPFLQAFYYE
jgi:hypothetical protein